MIFNRPLNPPILGDFPFMVPPKFGGLGWQNIPQIINTKSLHELQFPVGVFKSKQLDLTRRTFRLHSNLF